jgi:hypothetical protein
MDASWHQNINNFVRLVPNIRYYSQSAADFFTNVDDFLKPTSEYQSSDYRLSSFGAISGGVSLVLTSSKWIATLTAERYVATDHLSAYSVNRPSTALVSYNRISAGLEFSF